MVLEFCARIFCNDLECKTFLPTHQTSWPQNLLSSDGKVFFSFVTTCFSFAASKLLTSETSGLFSAIFKFFRMVRVQSISFLLMGETDASDGSFLMTWKPAPPKKAGFNHIRNGLLIRYLELFAHHLTFYLFYKRNIM